MHGHVARPVDCAHRKFFPLQLRRAADFLADVKRVRKHAHGSGDDHGIRSFESGVDHCGSSGRADLNVAADQGSRDRLPAGKLDHFEVFDSILLEVMPFLCGPERRLSRAENSSRSQRLLREKAVRRKE